MGDYKTFFTKATDSNVALIVDALVKKNEFNNKIFIIVADHGHTAIAAFDKVILYQGTADEKKVTPDNSCELNVNGYDDTDIQDSEKANNSLHIWELGEILKAVAKNGGDQFKILTPDPIAILNVDKQGNALPYGATSNIESANVIAALNGPMVHIYFKAAGGWADTTGPDVEKLRRLAESIKTYLKDGGVDIDKEETKNNFKNLLSSVSDILIRENGEYKIFNGLIENQITSPITDTSFGGEYVKAMDRIKNLNSKERSGDIILIMKNKTSDSDHPENRFTSGYNCKSWHGSLNPSDSYVPLIIAYPGGNKTELKSIADKTDGCKAATGCDGNWRVTNLIKTIINEQYVGQ